jgi:hypothetical protein
MTTMITAVTEPGVYPDMPEDEYHADPVPEGSLSSSGARKLLAPSCPSIYKHERDNRQPPKRTFDFGHAAHRAVLGIGMDSVIVQKTAKDGATSAADDYKTKSAQEHRDAIYAEGKVPLLAAEVDQVAAMAAKIKAHPLASALLDPGRGGKPEQSMFWVDDFHGVWRRARLDWLPKPSASGRLLIADYKTSVCAEPKAFAKSVFNLGYHQQAAWYIDAVKALGLAEEIAFVFVVQEKTAPYPVTVCELDYDALRIGRILNQTALGIFSRCQATGVWPDYSDQVELISPPPWVAREFADTDHPAR